MQFGFDTHFPLSADHAEDPRQIVHAGAAIGRKHAVVALAGLRSSRRVFGHPFENHLISRSVVVD